MRMFLRKSSDRRDPLAVTMSGVRMGERVLQVGIDDSRLAGALAGKVGLSGHAVIAVPDAAAAARARAGAAEAGGLVEVQETSLQRLPFGDRDFDAVIVHSRAGLLQALDPAARVELLRECRRVLRSGGRVIVIEAGEQTGLGAMFRGGAKPDPAYEGEGGALAALESAGYQPVRLLADRDGYRFVEGLNTQAGPPSAEPALRT